MFENYKTFSFELAGRPLTIEVGKLAQLANGSCLVRYGDTAVLAAATASAAPREGIDFFPLSVDFEEKLYAVGKIPGSFMKREGRPSEHAILTSRLIDRPIRPLFPDDMRNDVSVVTTVMSVDQDNSPEIAASIGASIAIAISDIPWDGPIGAVNVGLVDGKLIVNPNYKEREVSRLALTVAATEKKVVMIEAGASEVDEATMIEAIALAKESIKGIVGFINGIVAEIGKPKFSYPSIKPDADMIDALMAYARPALEKALWNEDKTVRESMMREVYDDVYAHFAEQYPDMQKQMGEALYKLQKSIVRGWILNDKKRVDGRGLNDIRPLAAEVALLARTHGSGLFTRGQTQVLTVATLGTITERQLLDGIDPEEHKRYMHHYNFPSYSVGETKPSRGPGRREIGHGALAERALLPVIPSEADFPYSIRLVSEVTSSNGSTSQGAICGSTLALMDAGVPISAPVAGISCGLVSDEDNWVTMVDIQGLEDFFGDMDFKVAGTKAGITAIQMDIKTDGLSDEVISDAIYKTRDARYYILDDIMKPAIEQPRPEVSPYAPKMLTITIDVDKIREVIGPGGKIIQKIVAETGAKIDIEDDGRVFIAAVDKRAAELAQKMIEVIVNDPEVGEIYKGTVTRLMTFGAFVEFAPGKEGLVHISKMDFKRIEKIEDAVSVGDEIWVKIVEIDKQGRINLSRRDAILDMEKKAKEQ